MNSKIQLLEKEKSNYLTEISELDSQVETSVVNEEVEIRQYVSDFFKGVLDSELKMTISFYGVRFERFKNPEDKFTSELFNVNFRRWDNYTDVEVNTYSTSIDQNNFQFELQRLTDFVTVSKLVFEKREELLQSLNQIKSKYKELRTPIFTQVRPLRTRVQDIDNEITSLERGLLLSRLEKEGLELKEKEGKNVHNLYHPFQYTSQDSCSNVRKIKIVSKSDSGKTCAVELEVCSPKWDDTDQKYIPDFRTLTVPKVKVDYIHKFVELHKQFIVKN